MNGPWPASPRMAGTLSYEERIPCGNTLVMWHALFTTEGRLLRRERGVKALTFDQSMHSVAVVTGTPYDNRDLPPDPVTIHDAATWIAGPAKKD